MSSSAPEEMESVLRLQLKKTRRTMQLLCIAVCACLLAALWMYIYLLVCGRRGS